MESSVRKVLLCPVLLACLLALSASAGKLHKAASKGNAGKVRTLLDNGADVDARNKWRSTPLHLAARSGSLRTVKLLLKNGADRHAENAWGRKPRVEAARNQHWTVVRRLMPGIEQDVPAEKIWMEYVKQVTCDQPRDLDRAMEKAWIAYGKVLTDESAQMSRRALRDAWRSCTQDLMYDDPDRPRRVMLVFPLVKGSGEKGKIGAGRGLIAAHAMWRSSFCPGRLLDTWNQALWHLYADQQLFGKGRKVTQDKIEELCASYDTENYITGSLETSGGRYKATIKLHGRNGTKEKVLEGKAKKLHRLPCRIARAAVEYFNVELSPPQERVMQKPLIGSSAQLKRAAGRVAAYSYFNSHNVAKFWKKLAQKNPTPWTEWMYLEGRLQRKGEPSANVLNNWRKKLPTTRCPALRAQLAGLVRRVAHRDNLQRYVKRDRDFGDAAVLYAPLTETSPYYGMALAQLARCIALEGNDQLANRLMGRLEKEIYPDSYLAPFYKGRMLVKYAWDIRGSGYAHTVSEQESKRFHKVLRIAKKNLESAAAQEPHAWAPHTHLIPVGMGLGLDDSYLREHFKASLDVCPTNPSPYRQLMLALEPKWGGSAEKMLELGRQAEATGLYKTRIPFFLVRAYWEIGTYIKRERGRYFRRRFLTSEGVWKRLKPVLERLMEQNRHNFEHRAFRYRWAYWNDNVKLTRKLWDQLRKAGKYRGLAFPHYRHGNHHWKMAHFWVGRCRWDSMVGAACRGDVKELRKMIEEAGEIKFDHKLPPQQTAACHGQIETLKVLLEAGADINATSDWTGRTGLHEAVLTEELETIQVLLEHGADTEVKDDEGNTPLALAARWGHLAAAKILLAGGADPLVKDEEGQPLPKSADQPGDQDVVIFLKRVVELQKLKKAVLKNPGKKSAKELRKAIRVWQTRTGASHDYVLVKNGDKFYLGQKPSRRYGEMLVSTPEPAILTVPPERGRPKARVKRLIKTLESEDEEFDMFPDTPSL